MAAQGSLKSILFALGANLGIAIAKSVGAFFTGSGSMLAEAIHSYTDCLNQVLLIVGVKRARKPPTDRHEFGYGKSLYFWSFLVAILLFAMGGLFSVKEGIHKLFHPEPLNHMEWAIGILVFSIILEAFAFYAAFREISRRKGTATLWQWFRQSRDSELIVIAAEDLGALAGLIFALVAVWISYITGNPLYDAIGTIGIGAILLLLSVLIAVEVHSLLLGESMDPDTEAAVLKLIRNQRNVRSVSDVRTMQIGGDAIFSCRIVVSNGSSGDPIEVLSRVEQRVREAFPGISYFFLIPVKSHHPR